VIQVRLREESGSSNWTLKMWINSERKAPRAWTDRLRLASGSASSRSSLSSVLAWIASIDSSQDSGREDRDPGADRRLRRGGVQRRGGG